MHDKRDYDEPIIATRRSRVPEREDAQARWPVVLALGGGLAVAVLLAWWFMGRSASDDASTTVQSESSAPESRPEIPAEIHVEQAPAPPARDADAAAAIPQEPTPPAPAAEPAPKAEQAVTPEDPRFIVPDDDPVPAPPAPVSVRFMSPDPQVQIELRRLPGSSPVHTSKAGEVVAVEPGTYRVVASGTQLDRFEQEVTFDGEGPLEYTVELCAERKLESESLVGRVVEKRVCASSTECESMFAILSEYADQLVRDRAFRTEQCAKWRSGAAPEGSWTLNIDCDGATPATTCRIAIGEGACMFAGPRRSSRGAACPRAELK